MTTPILVVVIARTREAAAAVQAYELPGGWAAPIRSAQGWYAWGTWCRDMTLCHSLREIPSVQVIVDDRSWREAVGWEDLPTPDDS